MELIDNFKKKKKKKANSLLGSIKKKKKSNKWSNSQKRKRKEGNEWGDGSLALNIYILHAHAQKNSQILKNSR